MTTLGAVEAAHSCRYVSGYLHHGRRDHDRSTVLTPQPMHAGGRRWCHSLSWVGFDPTNWLAVAGDRRIRTAIGRGSPTCRQLTSFAAAPAADLTVAVRVTPSEGAPSFEPEMPVPEDWSIWWRKQRPFLKPLPVPSRAQQMARRSSELECLLVIASIQRCQDARTCSFAPS